MIMTIELPEVSINVTSLKEAPIHLSGKIQSHGVF
jgi:chemotaxis family two-component system sensor kinase Cph1